MFKGIINQTGIIKNINKSPEGVNLVIELNNKIILNQGDSVCVDGVCLSVVKIDNNNLSFDVMNETLNKSKLKYYKENQEVNIEESLKLGDTIDGHFVSGHIDKTVSVKSVIDDGFSKRIKFEIDKSDLKFIVIKGSIAINGVSLTVSDVGTNFFEVSLIPITQEITTFKYIKQGDVANIEYDMFAKYINNYMEIRNGK